MSHYFSKKVVVVTGGSRGIGAALVRSYVAMGAIVYFTYLTSQQEADDLLLELASKSLHAKKIDSRRKNEIDDFIRDIGNQHGYIDILINNAGIVTNSLFYEEECDRWEETLEINLTAVKHYCQAALKYLAQSAGGNIVNISSMSARIATVGMAAYAASKAGVEILSEILTLEYAMYNIRVNTIAPGLINTRVADELNEEVRNKIMKTTPLRRLGEVADIANAVLFLTNNELASFITGSQLYITGGKHLT
jgi:NAD(P)-dependent dehydrogenase (short-subunit alcohol dehydrogenase family)